MEAVATPNVYSSVWVLEVSVEGSRRLAGYFISVPPLDRIEEVVKGSLDLLEGVRFEKFRGLSGNWYSFDLVNGEEKPIQCFASMLKVPYKGQD
jgi:hypothetical protein